MFNSNRIKIVLIAYTCYTLDGKLITSKIVQCQVIYDVMCEVLFGSSKIMYNILEKIKIMKSVQSSLARESMQNLKVVINITIVAVWVTLN